MSRRTLLALAVATALAVAASTPRASTSQAGSVPAAHTSTASDQTELSITVYNSNVALVRDVRTIQLESGPSDLHFMDIAATVNPATVHFRSLSAPAGVSVIEQNYEYDLLEPDKLLRKYVGRDVTLVRIRQLGGTSREETVTARLLSYNSAPVWQIGNEIVTGLQPDHIRFPDLPGNLFSRPTLIWTLDNSGGRAHRVEASYLASELAWNADYVLTVARDDSTADIDGWVTLRNGSGTAFPRARLQLVAGDLNRVRQEIGKVANDYAARERVMAAAAPMAEETLGDYHLYTLGRQTTINNNETKQVSMLNATRFPIVKRYVVNGRAHYYRSAIRPGAPLKDVVEVYYQLKNEAKAGLGMPMPAGVMRVYQADSRGGVQFMGEDRIGHTPRNEVINLKTGNAFDIVAERRQIDFQKVGTTTYELEYEVTLRNQKTTAVTVEVNEPVGGTWRVIRSTHPHVKTDAWAAQFNLPVAPEGETTLRYRVLVTY